MKKKIFKAGNYGAKGNYTKEKLESWIGKEFSVLIGHVGDYVRQGIPVSAIPLAGKCTVVGVDENNLLIGDVTYNEFGSKATKSGAYENYSIGISKTGEPDHLALLGYDPPHIDGLDKAFMEFSNSNNYTYIEFNKGGEGEMTLEELLAALVGLNSADRLRIVLAALDGLDVAEIDLQPAFTKLWELDDQKWYINKLVAEGYIVEKTAEFSKTQAIELAKTLNFEGLGFNLTEKPIPTQMTAEEWKAQYAKEFSMNNEKELYSNKFIELFPESLRSLAEFCVEQAYKKETYDIPFEFSAEEKIPFANFIKKTVQEGGPFKELFKNYSAGAEFNKGENEIIDAYSAGAKLANS